MKKIICIFIFVFLTFTACSRVQTVDDIFKLVSVTRPSYSYNGNYVLFTAGGVRYLLNTNTLHYKPFRIPRFRNAQDITWAKNRLGVYFMSPYRGRKRIYYYSLKHRTVKRIVVLPKGAQLYRLSSDKSGVVYTMHKNAPSKKYEYTYRKRPANALYYKDLKTGRSNKILDRQFYIQNFSFSPDKLIAVEYIPDESLNRQLTDIGIYNLKNKTFTIIMSHKGVERVYSWSPDGRYLTYFTSLDNDRWSYQLRLYLWDSKKNISLPITQSGEGTVSNIIWKNNSKGLYYLKTRSVSKELWFSDLKGTQKPLGEKNRFIEYFTLNRNNERDIVFTQENFTRPEELYISTLDSFTSSKKKLTSFNKNTTELSLGTTSLISWKSGGKRIEGILTLPVGYNKNSKYPLIVALHGGPAATFTRRFSGSRYQLPVQLFAGKGYMVLRPNPRGSASYGQDFSNENVKDWGGKDLKDVLVGVDYVIKQYPVDSKKIAITGWSYGGYLTALAIGKTNRFTAAVVGAGITNLLSYIGQVDVDEFVESYLGSPEKNLKLYINRSPITYTKNIKTPTLLIYGKSDNRVPHYQGLEFFRSLKRQGVPARLYVFPGMGHKMGKNEYYKYGVSKMIAWFDKYL
ncbi:prolyl oligopeptidase family serine peptidase [Candidatus Margulisiibacteriota bacterium]